MVRPQTNHKKKTDWIGRSPAQSEWFAEAQENAPQVRVVQCNIPSPPLRPSTRQSVYLKHQAAQILPWIRTANFSNKQKQFNTHVGQKFDSFSLDFYFLESTHQNVNYRSKNRNTFVYWCLIERSSSKLSIFKLGIRWNPICTTTAFNQSYSPPVYHALSSTADKATASHGADPALNSTKAINAHDPLQLQRRHPCSNQWMFTSLSARFPLRRRDSGWTLSSSLFRPCQNTCCTVTARCHCREMLPRTGLHKLSHLLFYVTT